MQILQRRIDAVVFGFRVRLDPPFLDTLRRRAGVACQRGRAEVRWQRGEPEAEGERAPLWGEIRHSRVEGAWLIQNHEFDLHINLKAPGKVEQKDPDGAIVEIEPGWVLEFKWKAPAIKARIAYARLQRQSAMRRMMDESARRVRQLGALYVQRLRRIDLAVDIEDFPLVVWHPQRVLRHAHTRMKMHKDDEVNGGSELLEV
jgi:hypothetical protein